MTTTEIRIAMAELDGFTMIHASPLTLTKLYGSHDKSGGFVELPGYEYDWNAVHRVVNAMSANERCKFLVFLDQVTAGLDWFPGRIVNSTCTQWCEAILKASGKWKE